MIPHTKKVCVIGAGVSGVVAAVHLKAAGLEVAVFERYSVAGGVWCVRICLTETYCTDPIAIL
jgi:cation diffusion facilitator CzcD-associated flavoprotein CzcO